MTFGPFLVLRMSTPAISRFNTCAALTAMSFSSFVSFAAATVPCLWKFARNSDPVAERSMAATAFLPRVRMRRSLPFASAMYSWRETGPFSFAVMYSTIGFRERLDSAIKTPRP